MKKTKQECRVVKYKTAHLAVKHKSQSNRSGSSSVKELQTVPKAAMRGQQTQRGSAFVFLFIHTMRVSNEKCGGRLHVWEQPGTPHHGLLSPSLYLTDAAVNYVRNQ